MGEDKRRRADSRSPERPRSGRGVREDDRDGGGRYDRGADRERDRERGGEHDWERGRDSYRERERGRERDSDREHGRGGHREDRNEGGAGRARIKDEPMPHEAPGPRDVERERDRERERRSERDWVRERDDRGGSGSGSGLKRERERHGDRDGEDWGPPPGLPGGRGGGGAGPGGRGPKRERGNEDWGPPPGGGGGRGGRESDSRYMSREEREAKQREAEEAAKPKAPKEQPNMELSGKLAAESNKVGFGQVLKHVPPADAKMPDKRWRLYVFKNDQLQDEPYRLHRHNHFLFGRDMGVADIITAHVSCSKQHAVLQYRCTSKPDEFGLAVSAVRPYLLDLGSVNGTFLNGERLEPLRYYELLEKDVIKFGQSSREYVLLHDKSGDADA